MNRRTSFICLLGLAVLLSASPARAAVLDSDTNLNGDAVVIPLESGTQNVAYDADTGFYEFGDRLADESNSAVTPAGLSLGAHYLRHNATSTSQSTRSINLDLNGGNLTATTGYISTLNTGSTGGISIINVGSIAMGDGYIETRRYLDTGGYNRATGNIQIGQDGTEGPRAGNIQVASIDASINHNSGGAAGSIVIHSTGNVQIQDSLGTGGTLMTGRNPGANGGVSNTVQVLHNGSFNAALVSSQRAASSDVSTRYDVEFNGGVLGGTPTGTFTVASIDSRGWLGTSATNNRTVASGFVIIQNYASVTIGQIDTSSMSLHATYTNKGAAGAISITNIVNDITITGTLTAAKGHPTLSATGAIDMQAGGNIFFQGGLDLTQVGASSFDAGGSTYISGALLGFDIDNPGSGQIDAPFGQIVYYDPNVAENAYLNSVHGSYYELASGGFLGPGTLAVPEPTTLSLLALGALGGLVKMRRRSIRR